MNFLKKKQQKYKEVFSGPSGEYVLASLFDFLGFYKQAFVQGDAYLTAFNEGKRAAALHILQLIAMKEEDLRDYVRSYREEMYSSQSEQGKEFDL